MFLWGWLAYAAPPAADEPAAPVDLVDVRAFLDWHCSDDNVPRYNGTLTLAEVPEGVVGAAERPFPSVEIGPAGIAHRPSREVLQLNPTVAIAADAPASVVADAFRWIASQLPAYSTVGVLMARSGTFAPRPTPPGDGAARDRIRDAEAGPLRDPQDHVRRMVRLYLAAGRCREVADAVLRSCEAGAERIVGALADRQCGLDEPEMIALFAAHWGQGTEGQPIVRVPVRSMGPDRFEGRGTWADAAPPFLARAAPAMVPEAPARGGVVEVVVGVGEGGVAGGTVGGSGGFEGARVFHHSELEVEKRAHFSYPEAALAMGLGTQRCRVRVLIGRDGVPDEAVVEGCPEVFHTPVREGVLQWRWRPPRDGRKRTAAQTIISVKLVPR